MSEDDKPITWVRLAAEVGIGMAIGMGIATGLVGWGLLLISLGVLVWK